MGKAGKMSDIENLTAVIIEAAKEIDGKKKLSCQVAHELADKFNVPKETIGQLCNDNDIKISNCQLGCFK